MKFFSVFLTALIATAPNLGYATDNAPVSNLDKKRYSIQTIELENDDPSNEIALYKDLDQDGVPDRIDHCLNTGIGYLVDSVGCELDSDKDGIYDRNDQCPDTPVNLSVNFLGCEGDADKDRVLDSKDKCPNTPLGTKVNSQGCKLDNDKDNDGVTDALDLCPNTPAGSVVNKNGCIPQSFVITNIVFNTGSYNIRADQQPILDRDAGQLRNLESTELLVITGYTDSSGSEESNLKLSWHRAQSTKDYLVSTFNLPEQQLFVLGKGEADPVDTNATAEGRQKNRRISLQITPIKDLPAGAVNNMPKEMVGYQRYKNR